jgi:hypothetical protein
MNLALVMGIFSSMSLPTCSTPIDKILYGNKLLTNNNNYIYIYTIGEVEFSAMTLLVPPCALA